MFASLKKIIGFGLCLVYMNSCGTKVGNPDDESTEQAPAFSAQNTVFTASSEAGPKVVDAEFTASLTSASWESGETLYEIYGLIREYDDSIHNGVIDGSNVYKAIHDASKSIDGTYNNCQLAAEQTLASPFDFGGDNLAASYNCFFDSVSQSNGNTYHFSGAARTSVDGISLDAMFGETTIESSQTTRTVVQASFNMETSSIAVNQAYLVDYAGENDYAVRLYLRGNRDTGLFTLKLSKGPGGGSGGGIAISGHGYAKGNKYYLFKVSSTLAGSTVDRYFCFESSTSLSELQAMDDSGSQAIPTNCSELSDGMPTEDYNQDGSSSPTGIEVFTGFGEFGTGIR